MTFDPERDERMAVCNGVCFIDNVAGFEFDAGWFRMAQIQQTRRHVAELRYRHPSQAFAIMMRVHHFRTIDPVLDRAYQWHMHLGLHEPQLTTRETWRMAWHNARCYLNHTRTDHD